MSDFHVTWYLNDTGSTHVSDYSCEALADVLAFVYGMRLPGIIEDMANGDKERIDLLGGDWMLVTAQRDMAIPF